MITKENSMAEKYCIYTGKYYPKGKMDREHVIPKALGGRGTQTILVSKVANSSFGSMIDGKLSHDFEMQFARVRNKTGGQSGKIPTAKIPNMRATSQSHIDDEGSEYSLVCTKDDGVVIQNQRTRKFLPAATINQSAFLTENVNIDHTARLKFLLKTLLGVGHQYMMPFFLNKIDLHAVRRLLFSELRVVPVSEGDAGIRYTDIYLAAAEEQAHLEEIRRRLCRGGFTSIMLRNHAGKFEWSVSVLGTLIGSVHVPIEYGHSLHTFNGDKPMVMRFVRGKIEVKEIEPFGVSTY